MSLKLSVKSRSMVKIQWVCSLDCGWTLLDTLKPKMVLTGGKCKCGGEIITKRKLKKRAWKKKVHLKRMSQNQKASLNRDIAFAVTNKTVRTYLKQE